jgi:putative membrane protein
VGFTNVSGLKKDDDGIWRGTVTLDGKSVPMVVDYKGNVVATTQTRNAKLQ